MATITGPGPYRSISDDELFIVWHLVPKTIRILEIIPMTPAVTPGRNLPEVKPFLRRMLYLHQLNNTDLNQLVVEISNFTNRNMHRGNDPRLNDSIAIGAKLLSLVRLFYEKPYAFPALLPTSLCIAYRDAMKTGADVSSIPANFGASTPIAALLGRLKYVAGVNVANAAYVATLINRNYQFYVDLIEREIALRGTHPDLAQATG